MGVRVASEIRARRPRGKSRRRRRVEVRGWRNDFGLGTCKKKATCGWDLELWSGHKKLGKEKSGRGVPAFWWFPSLGGSTLQVLEFQRWPLAVGKRS